MTNTPPEEDDTRSLEVTHGQMSSFVNETQVGFGRSPANDKRTVYTPMLICFQGTQRGVRFQLNKTENSLGRSPTATVRVDDELASRNHAVIHYSNIGSPEEVPDCSIEDVGSRNGTDLNGAPVWRRTRLRERDRITIGGTVLGFFLRDKSELELESSMIQLAMRDALTGLPNRHAFTMAFEQNLERCRRHNHPMSLLVVDIDHFKQVNDNFGHDVGDRALAHIAKILHEATRSTELCARWGGEEFTVLLPEGNCVAAHTLGERVRKHVELSECILPSITLNLTVSVGGAELMPGETPEQLFRRADQQLLKAKQEGRNQVCVDMGAYSDAGETQH